MSIFIRCNACRNTNSLKRKACSKCGKKLNGGAPSYLLEWREDGKRYRKTLHGVTLTQAKKIEADIRLYVKEGTKKVIEVGGRKGQTWGKVVESYLKYQEANERNPGTIFNTKTQLARFTEAWGADILLAEITPQMIENVKIDLRSTGYAKAYVDHHLKSGSSAWRKFDHDNLPNPFKSVKLFHPDNRITRYLTKEQSQRLLDAARTISRDFYEILFISLRTGLRRDNVFFLKRSEVDLDRGYVTVRQKGSRTHTIPISTKCVELLRQIPDNGTEFFWVNSITREPYKGRLRKQFVEAKKLAGIPPEFRWHDLRHHAASMALLHSGNLKVVQEFLGHKEIASTMRYAHLLPDHLRSVVEAMDGD